MTNPNVCNNNGKQAAVLVKASTEPVPPPHPDRSFYEQKVGLLWVELRAIYKTFLGHSPKCKNCGHEL